MLVVSPVVGQPRSGRVGACVTQDLGFYVVVRSTAVSWLRSSRRQQQQQQQQHHQQQHHQRTTALPLRRSHALTRAGSRGSQSSGLTVSRMAMRRSTAVVDIARNSIAERALTFSHRGALPPRECRSKAAGSRDDFESRIRRTVGCREKVGAARRVAGGGSFGGLGEVQRDRSGGSIRRKGDLEASRSHGGGRSGRGSISGRCGNLLEDTAERRGSLECAIRAVGCVQDTDRRLIEGRARGGELVVVSGRIQRSEPVAVGVHGLAPRGSSATIAGGSKTRGPAIARRSIDDRVSVNSDFRASARLLSASTIAASRLAPPRRASTEDGGLEYRRRAERPRESTSNDDPHWISHPRLTADGFALALAASSIAS
ncbi:hypothetical protein KM043_013419 [Ampulex compressa]|nr:hypothetical protein KM043_013419 [Ampulex compressa]